MGKTIRYDIVRACMEEYHSDKGNRRKKKKDNKMPRGEQMPPGKTHDLKTRYNRRKQKIRRGDWLDMME